MFQNNASSEALTILTETFKYQNSRDLVKVCLHEDSIKVFNLKSEKLTPDKAFFMRDIAGCSVAKSPKQNDKKAYLTVYMYPRIKKNSCKESSKRKREIAVFEYSNKDTYEGNLEVVKGWSEQLMKMLSRDLLGKPFIVYINPNSGSGKARTLFLERIKPIWAEASIPYAVILTKYANHAFEHVKELNLSEIRGIFVVSGDGLVYEVINGLMSREDWREAIKTPIGQLPGGSGNALSASICYLAKEAYIGLNLENFAMHMGFLTSKYDILPMDLVAVDISAPKNQRDTVVSNRVYSFLGIEWAIVADVDYESEKYRYLGGLRFTVGALARILNLRTYRGCLSFLPSAGSYTPKNNNFNMIRNPKNDEQSSLNSNKTVTNTSQPRTKYLTPLNTPVPEDWVVIDDRFVLVLVVHKPLIAKDFIAWADCKLENNEMLLIFIKAGISKMQLMKIFLDSETGAYLTHDLVESVRVKAFRIEPHEENSYMMVDGENVPYGPIQGEILEPMLNCIGKRIESYE